ncbi:hypothetical protein L218DRAFT_50587 [Marasmius fiardii PR-910]|nr:hypothetical protein L218DRAFT_50587 [Marasmius fiardii PR-910]
MSRVETVVGGKQKLTPSTVTLLETGAKTAMEAAATSPTSTVSSVALGPTPTCTNGQDFTECLPSGWKPKDRTDRSSLILTISLVLAFFICFFIIGCLLWRKSMRRTKDVEQRRHRRRKKKAARQGQEEARSMLEKELKTKKKIWANATARWKINAHYMAWRRRGKRTNIDFSTPQTMTPSTPVSPIHSRRTSTHVSRVSSPEPSRLSPRLPSPSGRRSPSEQERSSSPQPPPSPPTPTSSIPPSMSPPAYQHPRSSTHAPNYFLQQTACSAKTRSPLESITSSSPSTCDVTAIAEADVEILYTATLDSGHVATDDKAFLERLTYQASAPPAEEEESSITVHQISVPVWRDEEVSDFPPEDDEETRHPPSINHLFPPPPMPSSSEKGKMAMYYDYTFEEQREDEGRRTIEGNMLGFEPEAEGSAPPFDDGEIEPFASAPPLVHDDEDQLEYLDEPEPQTSARCGGHDAGEACATPDSSPPLPLERERERRDSSLQQLGLDFEVVGTTGTTADSLPHDLPVYRP